MGLGGNCFSFSKVFLKNSKSTIKTGGVSGEGICHSSLFFPFLSLPFPSSLALQKKCLP